MAELRRVSRAPGPPRLSAGPAVAPELAVRLRPHSVGVPALHLMRSGCLSHPSAPAARSHGPWSTPTRARDEHGFAGPRTRWRTDAPRKDSLVPSPGRARRLGRARRRQEARAPRPGSPRVAPGGHGPGPQREGLPIPSRLSPGNSRLSSHNSPSGFCASPSPRGGSASSPLSPGRPARLDSRFWSGSLSFFSRIPARLRFLLPSGSPGKVASPSLPKTSPSLRGGGWERGVCERDRSPELQRACAGFPPAAPGWALQPAPAGSRH